MVKVQKPKPKTFTKVTTADNPIKKKKPEIIQKAKANAVVIPDAAPPSKNNEKTKKLIKETVIEAKIVQKPEKKPKYTGKKAKGKIIAEPDKSSKEAKSKHRPQVLAPPESPKPTPPTPTPTPSGGKHKNKNVKIQETGAPAVANPAFEKKKKQHKLNKSAANGGDATKFKAIGKRPKQSHNLTKHQEKKAFIHGYHQAFDTKEKQQKYKNEKAAAHRSNKVESIMTEKERRQADHLTKEEKKEACIKAYKAKRKERKQKEKVARVRTFEPPPFDEERFHSILNEKNVKSIAKALKVQCEKDVADKKTSIFSDYRYVLDVASFRIPSCPRRVVKLSLKHSLVDKDDDVAIVVTDLQRGAKVDFEPTIQHYEDVFREAGVEGLKIVPFNQLRTECNSFESVRKFSNTYDYFLCDGRIVKLVAGFTGKVFQKPRTTFHAVRMDNTKDIKKEIEKSLNRTAYRRLAKGDIISIPVGTHKHSMQQLSENIIHVIEQLKNSYPGGFANIRSVTLKTNIVGNISLPLYISMAQAPADTPYVVGEREQRMLKMKKEANEVLSKFAMTKDAQIIKLSKDQVERKRQVKEAKAALADKIETPDEDGDDDDNETPLPAKKVKKAQKAEAPQDDDDDGEVPAKKTKKEQKAEVEKDSKKKQVEEQAEPEDEDDDDDAENDSDDEDGDDDDDGEDDDDDDEGDGNGDVDEEGDDDDDEDDADDDDDDEGDDDEDGDDNEDSD